MISNSNLTLLFEASHRLWTGIIGEKGKEVKSFREEILEKLQKSEKVHFLVIVNRYITGFRTYSNSRITLGCMSKCDITVICELTNIRSSTKSRIRPSFIIK